MKTIQSHNIILTGPPRSGTTLACKLLNELENTTALHEPMNLKLFKTSEEALQNIADFFETMRTSILENGTAIARIKAGKIPDNPFDNTKEKGLRKSKVTKGTVHFDKPFTSDFRLFIKHNAHFTFLLNHLKQQYPCYAIIRDPVSTIASWNTIDAPVARGNVKVLKGLQPELHKAIDSIPDLLDRQVRLLHEHFKCYQSIDPEQVIKYEDIVETNGAMLAKQTTGINQEISPLTSKNNNQLYDKQLMKRIARQLNQFEGAYHQWYEI